MPAPALRIPLSLNMDDFKKGVQDAKSATSEATQFIVKKFVDMNASVLATGGASGAAVLGLRSLVGTLGFVGGGITAVVAAFKLMAYATDLAKEKIEEFNDIAEKAGTAGVSNDFFQRFVKGSEQLKLSVDDATEALNNFQEKSQDALGGSSLQRRIDALQKAGNFSGNSGVAAFGVSSDTQQKLQAIVSLIDQALNGGQRLAALDLADKAFGPKIADNLRADSGYLDKMLETANQISASKIIDDAHIGQAIDLKTRLEDAQKVLSERWKPIQDDLAKLGMNYQQSWVDIYQDIAIAVGYATQLYNVIKQIPDFFQQIGNAPGLVKLLTQINDVADKFGLVSHPEGVVFPGQADRSLTSAGTPAFDALRAGLQNPAAVRAQQQQATSIQSRARGDTSKDIGDDTIGAKDSVDRAIDSLRRHTDQIEADTKAVGLGDAALASSAPRRWKPQPFRPTAVKRRRIRPPRSRSSRTVRKLLRARLQGREWLTPSPEASRPRFCLLKTSRSPTR